MRAARLLRRCRAEPRAAQIAMVNELFTLAAHKNVEKGLPGFRLQQWYFFFAAAFFGYGRMLKNNLLAEVAENDWLPGVIGAHQRRRAAATAAQRPHTQPYRAAFWVRRHARRARCAAARDAAAASPAYAAAARHAPARLGSALR